MHSQHKPGLLDRPESIAALLDFEERTFDHLESASDLALLTALYDVVDRVTDQWLRVELDAIATVAANRWAPAAVEALHLGRQA